MNNSICYHFDPATGRYIGPGEADESPLDPGLYLIPAHAVRDRPPELKQHEAAVISASGDGWDIVADYVGVVYWLPDGSQYTIDDLGICPPAGSLDSAPFLFSNALQDCVDRIRQNCREAIEAGVLSDALGMPHTYPTSVFDQQNLDSLVLSAFVNGSTAEPYKFWCADADGVWVRRSHTSAQIIAVGKVVQQHIAHNQDLWETKLAEIEAATGRDVVVQDVFGSIVWT